MAAMDPGLRDREYYDQLSYLSEWLTAAMEPGLRDREYDLAAQLVAGIRGAAMEPGLRDREYPGRVLAVSAATRRCNGARS